MAEATGGKVFASFRRLISGVVQMQLYYWIQHYDAQQVPFG
jgi:hypothetical protein